MLYPQLFVYDRDDPEEQASTFILTLDPERTYRPLLKTRFYETGANLSPDGNWLAYTSNESGRREIYVRPFPDIDTGKWQVSTGGGTVPVWSPDGSELFYWNRTEFMRVTMDTSSRLTAGVPEVLFSGPYYYGYSTPSYDIAPDGSRFLMLKPIEDESGTRPQINVVLNWFEELTARVPTDNYH